MKRTIQFVIAVLLTLPAYAQSAETEPFQPSIALTLSMWACNLAAELDTGADDSADEIGDTLDALEEPVLEEPDPEKADEVVAASGLQVIRVDIKPMSSVRAYEQWRRCRGMVKQRTPGYLNDARDSKAAKDTSALRRRIDAAIAALNN